MPTVKTKPRLVVLSDLWGSPRARWLNAYQQYLSEHWDWVFYDCIQLAQLDLVPYEQEALHRQFVGGGIEKAVAELIRLEKGENPPSIMAFSIGGTIAWQAIQAGWEATFLLAISATRLRYEREPLPIPGHLIYGADDPYRPDHQWLEQSKLPFQIIAESSHELYRNPDWIFILTQALRT